MITLDDAKTLEPGDILHDRYRKRWKVNGAVKTWKTDPTRIRVPLKHGLYTYDAIDEGSFVDGICHDLTLGEPPQLTSKQVQEYPHKLRQ